MQRYIFIFLKKAISRKKKKLIKFFRGGLGCSSGMGKRGEQNFRENTFFHLKLCQEKKINVHTSFTVTHRTRTKFENMCVYAPANIPRYAQTSYIHSFILSLSLPLSRIHTHTHTHNFLSTTIARLSGLRLQNSILKNH